MSLNVGDATVLNADAREGLAELASNSVNCIVTSPPYWGLRDYGVVGQIGLETTLQEYIDTLVEVFRQARRVLKEDGTFWLNLGDTYSHDAKSGGETSGLQSYIDDRSRKRCGRNKRTSGLKSKDLCMVPARVAIALQDDGWWLRQDIVWSKPNPMPESVRDRCTKAHEYIFLLSKSPKYYWDAETMKEPVTGNAHSRGHGVNPKSEANGVGWGYAEGKVRSKQNPSFSGAVNKTVTERNKRSVWTVNTYALKDAHFATFPPKLIEPCILAGCPPDGTVLDPFHGAGTTGMVALEQGRKYIGIELNPTYIKISKPRLERAWKQQRLIA